MPRTPPPPQDAQPGIRLYDRLAQAIGLPTMPVIVADEIARQIDALPDSDASPPASAYGLVAPPFKTFFVEADTFIPDIGLVQRGVLIEDYSEQWRSSQLSPAVARIAPPTTRWLLAVSAFINPRIRPIHGYAGAALICIDQQGRLLTDTERVDIIQIERNDIPTLPAEGIAEHLPYALKAISAMHQRCPVDQVRPPRQARRAAERQGIAELHEYYVLKIKPSAPTDMRQVGQPSRAEAQRREHTVRGHFRYYPPEAPLFGRTAGMVFIPAHERGDSDIGAIKKDYEV